MKKKKVSLTPYELREAITAAYNEGRLYERDKIKNKDCRWDKSQSRKFLSENAPYDRKD